MKKADKAVEVIPPKKKVGRPNGSRAKLGSVFIDALYDDFLENGVEAIKLAREDDPMGYLKVIAFILPKTVELKTDFAEKEQIDATIATIESILGNVDKLPQSIIDSLAAACGTGTPPLLSTVFKTA